VRKILVPLGMFALVLAGPALFLVMEWGDGLSGFPLDDAWIHQAYARSLAAGLGWSYAGGPASAGSTSPLWTVLQVPSFWLRIPPVTWSSALGVVFLLVNAVWIWLWLRKSDPEASRYAFFLCIGEWHLVWAALSGMETLLFCCWISSAMFFFFPMDSKVGWKAAPYPRIFLLGLLGGMGLWIRPEAVLLSGLILPAAVRHWKTVDGRRSACFLLGFLLPLLAYFFFQLSLNGRFLPNTFFVKPAEYSGLTSASFFLRLLQPWPTLLAGLGAIAALFLPAAVGTLVRDRRILAILPAVWALIHLAVYAVQLPATYQHGRYFLPLLPVLIGYGAYGFAVLRRKWEEILPARIVLRALGISAALLAAFFLWIGARQFVRDVQTIGEIVALSQWVRDNTPADTVVAAHDIGALGFWGERRIVDLGGVTDLGALPLLRGSISLREFLRQKTADLLMTMPVFYPGDLDSCVPVPDSPRGLSPGGAEYRTLLYDWRTGCTW
jgi:arabinofuranosyltransferase